MPLEDTTKAGWTDITSRNPPSNRQGVGSVGPFSFRKGETIVVDSAVTVGLKEGNSNLENVGLLKENIRKVRDYYNANPFECYDAKAELIEDESKVYVFPNPFTNYINAYVLTAGAYEIFDLTGTSLKVGQLNDGVNFIWLGNIVPKGVYVLNVDDGNQQKKLQNIYQTMNKGHSIITGS